MNGGQASGSYPHASSNGVSHLEHKMSFPPVLNNTDYDDGQYEPELDAGANPEYYDINSVLFHAHLSRLQRISRHLSQ
jgi:hypothetical protein